MREVGRDLWSWLADGAHVYVCGDAKRMAKDVERALVDIVAPHGARSTERGDRLRRRPEESRPLSAGRVLIAMHAPIPLRPSTRTDLPLLRRRLRRAGARRTARAARRSPAIPTIRRISAGSARRARRSARRSALDRPAAASDAAAAGRHATRASTGTRRSTTVADGFRRIVERDGPGRGRVLSLRPVADRGLLRRQQADEGLPRLGQRRHQFAALHGVVGRRPPPRLRRRHRARQLRGSRRGRSDRAGRLQRRLVPSGAVPAHGAQPARARRQDRRDRSAPHRDRGRGRSVPRRSRPARIRRCSAACWSISPSAARSIRPTSTRTPTGFADALARAREIAPDVGSDRRARPASTTADVARFFDLFRATERAVTCYSQGVNQSAQGTDKVNAIINCHLATGRIGKPGMGPFSLTGQPNAMGGREVGGLANQLAAHMGFSPAEIDRVRPLLECAAHGASAKASRPCRCSRRSSAARSRRCG